MANKAAEIKTADSYTWEDVGRAARNMEQTTGRPGIYLDFEFNNSSAPVLNLVSCSVVVFNDMEGLQADVPLEFWLHTTAEEKKTGVINANQVRLTGLLERLRDNHGAVFIGYGSAAECRSFEALGLDPHAFGWIDLFAEWRQLTFNNDKCQYGTYFTKTGFRRFSVAPHYDKNRNKGRDNNAVGAGMVDAVAQLFDVFISSEHKNEMRDLIIADHDEYTEAEQRQIMDYCTSDIKFLPLMWEKMFRLLQGDIGLDSDTLFRVQLRRGEFIASIAKMETVGFPLLVDQVHNLRNNFDKAEDEIITDLVKNHYAFYIREKKRASDVLGRWVDKYDQFVAFIKKQGLYETWPRTVNKDTGRFTDTLAREDKILGDYDGIPEIKAYRQAKKLIKQLAWFKEPDTVKLSKSGDFFDNVGFDNRLRSFLGPFGTQTGRNAPKASRFVLAMSSWLRCLIHPEPGFSIIGIDYASQEFAIAAVLANDANMVAAYRSGDPYLYFAKKAGAVPLDADPKLCKNPALILKAATAQIKTPLDIYHLSLDDERLIEKEFPEVWKAYQCHQDHKEQRGLFKSTTLGLQYGMGADKLAVKLAADMGRPFTRAEAEKLISLHKKVYPTYWKWSAGQVKQYERQGKLLLWDGWALLGDNDNSLSVKNFPVQGTGSAIMREAVRLAHKENLAILSPLHDALYMIAPDDKVEDHKTTLSEAMLQAVRNVLYLNPDGSLKVPEEDVLEIRLDIDVHAHGETWVEEKGERFYKMLHKYLMIMKTTADRELELKDTVLAGPYN